MGPARFHCTTLLLILRLAKFGYVFYWVYILLTIFLASTMNKIANSEISFLGGKNLLSEVDCDLNIHDMTKNIYLNVKYISVKI